MKRLLLVVLLFCVWVTPAYSSKQKQKERLGESTIVLEEVLNIPEGIPADLLKKAECVVIIPSMKKAAFGIGGNYGRGCILCRTAKGWSPPVMVSMTGGSVGFQIGGSATDVVLLVMNKRGINKLLSSKFTLGVDGSAAAGPKGRTAQAMTDAQMGAEILSYARSRGLFAGISLDGSVLKPDTSDNEDLYGRRVWPKKMLLEGGPIPASAEKLITILSKY